MTLVWAPRAPEAYAARAGSGDLRVAIGFRVDHLRARAASPDQRAHWRRELRAYLRELLTRGLDVREVAA